MSKKKSEKIDAWKVAYFRAYYLTEQQAKEWTDERVEEEIKGWVGGDPFITTTAVAYRRGWDARGNLKMEEAYNKVALSIDSNVIGTVEGSDKNRDGEEERIADEELEAIEQEKEEVPCMCPHDCPLHGVVDKAERKQGRRVRKHS